MLNELFSKLQKLSATILVLFLFPLTLVTSGGCASDKQAKTELQEGYAALDSHQYDEAMNRADAFLQHTPSGPGSAEALYLRGRSLERRTYANRTDMMNGYNAARASYIQGLGLNPPAKLESLLHAGVANVAYYQDDYQTALDEWTAAYDKLEGNDAKAWALYRAGICRQRLGQFADADAAFAAVQERFPDSEPSSRARAHQGVRSFTLQLATFGNAGAADSAVTSLRREGVMASESTDPAGHRVVTVGPFNSYQQALALKVRYASRYPDAIILP